MSGVEKMRIHSINFSEIEYEELNAVLNFVPIPSVALKNGFTEFWKFMNRMSYIAAHGTEEGWSDQ